MAQSFAGLTGPQSAACAQIRDLYEPDTRKAGRDGWSVFRVPSTLNPPRRLYLLWRHTLSERGWQIYPDGTWRELSPDEIPSRPDLGQSSTRMAIQANGRPFMLGEHRDRSRA